MWFTRVMYRSQCRLNAPERVLALACVQGGVPLVYCQCTEQWVHDDGIVCWLFASLAVYMSSSKHRS